MLYLFSLEQKHRLALLCQRERETKDQSGNGIPLPWENKTSGNLSALQAQWRTRTGTRAGVV